MGRAASRPYLLTSALAPEALAELEAAQLQSKTAGFGGDFRKQVF